MTGVFQSDPLEKRFGLYRSIQGSNYHLSCKAIFQAEKKLRLSSIIDLSKSFSELTLMFENLIKPKIPSKVLGHSDIIKFSTEIFSPGSIEDTKVSFQDIVYYITGFAVKKCIKSLNMCSDCIKLIRSNRKKGEFSGLIDHNDLRDYLCHPSNFLIQKMFCLDFILNSLCNGKLSHDFRRCEDKFFLITTLFETQIDISNLKCSNNHLLKPALMKIFEYYINIFLKRDSDFRNDFRSGNNIRKLLIFDPEYESSISLQSEDC